MEDLRQKGREEPVEKQINQEHLEETGSWHYTPGPDLESPGKEEEGSA